MTVQGALHGAGTGWFTPAEEELRKDVAGYLAAEVLPRAAEWERAGELPLREVLTALGTRGWLGARFPRERGGGGRTLWEHVVLAECLGEVPCDSLGMAVTVHQDMVAPLLADSGTEEAVERFLRPALRGTHVLAHAVSEAGAGSDVASVAATAVPTGEGYELTGTKRWVTAGRYADSFAVLARLPQAPGPFGHVLLMVPAGAEGVCVRPGPPTLGMHAAGLAGEVRFESVRVPKAHRIGGHGLGLVTQLRQFEQERILASCRSLAIASRLLAQTREHLEGRETFGAPVASRQDVSFRLARLRAAVESARQLAYTAADRWATGGDYRTLSAAAKLRAGRLVRETARLCLHLHGTEGQLTDSAVNRAWRDARLFSLSTGSDEMMLTTLARLEGWDD
ncbi:acyl-CoA dehydrogenase [Streptomyces sp. NBRC 110611]|uniref:acyl-CoA dehydrogenase family protein n=1 Tax=Streptomyces sp. NBRC 110611 TaxID=1621259 RepID=UPI0008347D0C|nr:acyl-CoA dehydrogenase family protein [Streptomyces sp. NBRC 110611]GAU67364.1 acyl-CoA dehydrogenase [Streptomyces sp. NBRC 110611]